MIIPRSGSTMVAPGAAQRLLRNKPAKNKFVGYHCLSPSGFWRMGISVFLCNNPRIRVELLKRLFALRYCSDIMRPVKF